MTKLILITLLLLTGCSKPVACIDGKLWKNEDLIGFGDIYTATNVKCREIK